MTRFFFAVATAGLAIACSGAGNADVFGSPQASQSGTDPEPSATSRNGGSANGSAPTTSEPPPSSTDAGAKKDAAPEPPVPTGTIPCGGETCTAKSEVCCIALSIAGQVMASCKKAGAHACGLAMPVACNDRTDCPANQVCCGTVDSDHNTASVECRATCESSGGAHRARACDPNAATDECADQGQTCTESSTLSGVFVCQS